MNIPSQSRVERRESRAKPRLSEVFGSRPSALGLRPSSAFTLVEIAISLAIIGIALVAIIGVLPRGLDVQRENRERTIINLDATVFMEAIRNGAQGADDLTNYVYRVEAGDTNSVFNNGWQIIGLLTTPGYTNHANVRSISGSAVEKPPQDNPIVHGDPSNPQGDTFAYRMLCETLPVPTADNSTYDKNLTNNLHELRLTFFWPILPNGNLPPRPLRQTFRTLIAGQIMQTNDASVSPNRTLYFFQNRSFTNAP